MDVKRQSAQTVSDAYDPLIPRRWGSFDRALFWRGVHYRSGTMLLCVHLQQIRVPLLLLLFVTFVTGIFRSSPAASSFLSSLSL